MVLINELTVEQINAALLHLQRSKDEVVGGNKGTTIQNITISNSGGGSGNNVDYSGTIKNIANLINKNTSAIEKNAGDIAKLKSDFSNIEKSVEDTLEGLVDNGISDLSFDPLTKQLTITTNDGDIYQAIIEQDIGYLSYDSATNKLILTTGNQSQEITLPYILSSEKGSANGVATLDENGRVPYSQLPESAMEFLGQWNASTNTPHLADGTGTNGDFYIVSTGGTVNLGTEQNPHIITVSVNDRIVYEGDIAQWVRLPAGQVSSVNGQSGEVVLTASDINYSTGVTIKDKIDANAVQADWSVTDTSSLAYIKNKPIGVCRADYLSTYPANGSDNISSLKAVFDTVPKSVGTAVRLQHGTHSMAFGWFLNGYACANAYGGWFVSDYNIPKFVGINNGYWAECTIITSGTIGSQTVACAGNASFARLVYLDSYTGNADRPIMVTSGRGTTGYSDQGVSTACPLTFNPATGVLKAACFQGDMSVSRADKVYYSTLVGGDDTYPLVFIHPIAGCNYVSLESDNNFYFKYCYNCLNKSYFHFHAQIAPRWRILPTPTFTCSQGSDTGTNWFLGHACIDDVHQKGQVEVWSCTTLTHGKGKSFSITLEAQVFSIKTAIFTYMCDASGSYGGPELAAFVVGTCRICFGVFNRNSSTNLCRPHFLLQWWY